MKTIETKAINFRGDIVEIITPKYSPFVVTVKEGGVSVNFAGTIIGQKHINAFGHDEDFARQAALDTAYRQAMVWLLINERCTVQALYRHLVRTTSDGLVEPEMIASVADQVTAIMKLTSKANDMTMRLLSEVELEDATEKEFTLCLTHGGEIFTHDGTSFQIEMLNVLTGLPVLGRPELSEAL